MKQGNEVPNLSEGRAFLKRDSNGIMRLSNTDILVKNSNFDIDTPDIFIYTGSGHTATLKTQASGTFFECEIYNVASSGVLNLVTQGGLNTIFDPTGNINSFEVAPNLPVKFIWANNLWLIK